MVARELGIDIEAMRAAQSSRGRIVEADVRQFWERMKSSEASAPLAQPIVEPATRVRRTIATRMSGSWRTVPHFYLTVHADVNELQTLRQQLLSEVQSRTGVRLSYTDLFIKAVATALRKHPEVNVSWQDERIIRRNDVHVGFAAQLVDTLVVLVIRNADRLTLSELARERNALIEKARGGRLAGPDLEGASITLSNLGPFGVDEFQAIISPPESAIIAVGRIGMRPAVLADQVVPRLTVSLTASFDHRVVDGAAGAVFLRCMVDAMEAPYNLLL